ncbi:XRE family transcriptional regulator [Rhodococcus sp. ACPA4]|uniref:helix-turn-helix domain-containing protein n=1 Tax=unclassified Rhodococcus (in: high G+C Gram-positive bacteria) TaxID=192944 RepID=UPI000BB0D66C|nr:cupin domain-containing protein [Rhodococcus sp. ACPA4]NRI65369.1 cupin domain-containing protein [Rhodococcus sp. MS16]PBC37378.1 XRE family transcriptional regulator [Rhodococcus sp. ACPA4]
MIGAKLRELRSAQGMTLRGLASETGLSPTLLSQVERGVTEPSLKTLRALATVFGQSVSTLFEEPIPMLVHVSRPGQRSRISSPAGHIQYERLTPGNGQLEVLRGTLKPGECSSDEPWSHEAVECVYVLFGELTVTVGKQTLPVVSGEAITIDSSQPHKYSNNTVEKVEFLVSVTPPTP